MYISTEDDTTTPLAASTAATTTTSSTANDSVDYPTLDPGMYSILH